MKALNDHNRKEGSGCLQNWREEEKEKKTKTKNEGERSKRRWDVPSAQTERVAVQMIWEGLGVTPLGNYTQTSFIFVLFANTSMCLISFDPQENL